MVNTYLSAMIADSMVLPDQLAIDVVVSAFSSERKNFSALRILYIQEDIADYVTTLIRAMILPLKLESTKIHADNYNKPDAELVVPLIPPAVVEVASILEMEAITLKPTLYIVRYTTEKLEKIIDEIKNKKYILSLAIRTRSANTYQIIAKRMKVANIDIILS